MLDWIAGSSRSSDPRFSSESVSNLDEPPETPAHLFAVRAFKTAIFGTPRPVPQHAPPCLTAESVQEENHVNQSKPDLAITTNTAVPNTIPIVKSNTKSDCLISPAKGILLTPGTGATRRKTVSFRHFESNAQLGKAPPKDGESPISVNNAEPKQNMHRSSLTRTLIAASKQKTKNEPSDSISESVSWSENIPTCGQDSVDPSPTIGSAADQTIDLSQPLSRSGRHWKAEYEQYHRRSNREMKKMIRYGQNIKSYAVKKDSEATKLGEKLTKEMQKAARMEARVSKLAKHLSIAQDSCLGEDSDTTKLVSELAQQTAKAIQYKQKVEQYRRMIQEQSALDVIAEAELGEDSTDALQEGLKGPLEEQGTQSQLENLRVAAVKAEGKAARLEKENANLKRNLARVKDEMMSYESRRQAREERLNKREENHKAAKNAAEAELEQLKLKHHDLLQVLKERPSDSRGHATKADEAAPKKCEGNLVDLPKFKDEHGMEPAPSLPSDHKAGKTYLSPRKRSLQKSSVDIWTLSSPKGTAIDPTPSEEQSKIPPSSVRHDIHRTLKEIDQNLMPEARHDEHSKVPHNNSVKDPTVIVDLTASRRSNTPRAMVNRASSITSRIGARTSSMSSTRGSMLPADRAAAARARLAQRSAEKRNRVGSIRA